MMSASIARRSGRSGFTLVELLVVIAIIVVLAAVVLFATRTVQTSAAKAADMTNLKSLLGATVAAADDSTGVLPPLHDPRKPAPHWLVDRDTLESYGFSREFLYSPGKDLRGGKPAYDWWLNRNDQPIEQASGHVETGLDQPAAERRQVGEGQGSDTAPVQTHYVYFANDAGDIDSGWYKTGAVTPPKPSEFRGARTVLDDINSRPSAQSRMVFPRKVTDECWYPILWSGLCFKSGKKTYCAFLKDNEPLGINVIYLDGHAEWVPGAKLKARFRNAGGSYYW